MWLWTKGGWLHLRYAADITTVHVSNSPLPSSTKQDPNSLKLGAAI